MFGKSLASALDFSLGRIWHLRWISAWEESGDDERRVYVDYSIYDRLQQLRPLTRTI